jgi:hypothetical protein
MFPGIHDSQVVAYLADSRSEQLILCFAPGTGSAAGEFRLIFGGVVAHQFPFPLMPSIVSSLVEIPADLLLKREASNLAEGSRQCGWPGSWFESLESGVAYCASAGLRGFDLEQSYGMSGWVLARSVQHVAGGL